MVNADANNFHTDRFECSVGGKPFQAVRDPWQRKSFQEGCMDGTGSISQDGFKFADMLRVRHVKSGAMGSAPIRCAVDDGWDMIMALVTDATKTEAVGLQLYCFETQKDGGGAKQSDLVIATPSRASHQLVQKVQEKIVQEQPLLDESTKVGEEEKGKKEERTFLQKYWMFILLAVYVVLNASRPSTGQTQQPASRN